MTTRDDKFTPLERQALARQRAETHPKIAPLKLKDRLHTPGRSALVIVRTTRHLFPHRPAFNGR